MAPDRKQKPANNIPIRFPDDDATLTSRPDADEANRNHGPDEIKSSGVNAPDELSESQVSDPGISDAPSAGPEVAELVASRAELKRLKAALAEAQNAVARRQADFENYRKRVERDRGEAHNRLVADVARKLLPVIDNLARALDAERSMEGSESSEFRHFLHGVELISKQLNEVLDSLGIQPIAAIGERFDPHIHEAVATEPSGEFEPDIVTEEIARGYRIGERLLRPAMVKVSARKSDSS